MKKLPKQLQKDGFRFLKLRSGEKGAFEKNWQRGDGANYPYDGIVFSEWLKDGNGYGVIAGYGGLIVIETDNKVTEDLVKEYLPRTFSVRSPGHNGLHFYFICPDLKENIKLLLKDVDYGQVQAKEKYVVGPGSIHPNGGRYVVEVDEPIAMVTSAQVKFALRDFLINPQERKQEDKFSKESNVPEIPLDKILDTSQFKSRGTEYYGSHPVHGSDTGINFHFNPSKGVWHCFRCDSGGGPLSLIAVLNGVITCDNAKTGKLRGEEFLKTLEIARAKYGLALPGPKKDDSAVKDVSELMSQELAPLEYWSEPLIVKGTLTLIGGRPGCGKSLFTLALALDLVRGRKFLGNFSSEGNPKVILYDLENGERIIQRRISYLLNGDSEKVNPKQFFLSENFDKGNMKREFDLAMAYDVVIIDSYRRFLKGEENASEITDQFYREFLKPLRDAGKTLIILHHFRKSRPEDIGDEELLDMFRGSSDITAQVDTAYGLMKGSEEHEDGVTRFEISVYKAKDRIGLPFGNFSFSVKKDDELKRTDLAYSGEKKFESPELQRIEKLCSYLKDGPKKKRDIMILFSEFSAMTVNRILTASLERGSVVSDKKGLYRLPESQETEVQNYV